MFKMLTFIAINWPWFMALGLLVAFVPLLLNVALSTINVQ